MLDECFRSWLLKTSSSESAHKFHRTRTPYKRLSRLGWTFSIPKSAAVFSEGDFFNTHGSSQRLTFHARQFPAHWPIIITDPMICAINPWWVGSEAYASAKFT